MIKSFRPAALAAATIAALALAACGKGPEERLASAQKLLDKGEPASAVIELKNVLASKPDSPQGRFLLGQALFRAGDALGAEIELNRAQERDYDPNKVVPLLAEVLVALNRHMKVANAMGSTELQDPAAYSALKVQVAIALMALGRLDEAQAALDSSLERSPSNQPALEVMARLKSATGDLAAAMLIVNGLIEKQPGDPAAWTLKGDVLASTGPAGRTEAITAYKKALELKPGHIEAHGALITAEYDAGRFDEARAQWQKLSALRPNHPQTRFFEAVLALQKGDVNRARELSQGLIKLSPDNPRLQLLAGQTEMLAGAFVQAETHLAKASQLSPEARPPRETLTELYLRMGQASRALETLTPLLKGTSDPSLFYLAGRAQLLAGNGAAAELAFNQAAKAAPQDPRNRTGLALAQLAKGKTAAALAALEEIAKTDSSSQADLPLINARVQRKEYSEALAAIDRLAAKSPQQAYPDLLRAQVAGLSGNLSLMRQSLAAALAKEPNHLGALVSQAELDVAEGKREAATAPLRAALKRQPANTALKAALADFVGRTGGAKTEVVSLMQEAIQAKPQDARLPADLIDYALNMSDNALALTTAQAAAPLHPDNPALLQRLGRAQQASGDMRQALNTFGKLAALQPTAPEPLVLLSSVHAAMGNLDAAWLNARRALELGPDEATVQTHAVAMAVRSRRIDEALTIARTVQKQASTQGAGWYLEGQVELSRNNPEAAVAALRKVSGKESGVAVAQLLHTALLAAKKDADAAAHAEAWMKAHPKDLSFLLHLGLTAQSGKNFTEAEKRYRQMLAQQPNNLEALNNLAQLLVDQKLPGALALAEKANQLAPNSPPLLDTLAQSMAAEGRTKDALKTQVRVVGLSPDQPEFRLTLARLQIMAGDKDPAIANLTKLSKLGASFGKQDEVAQLLRSLGG